MPSCRLIQISWFLTQSFAQDMGESFQDFPEFQDFEADFLKKKFTFGDYSSLFHFGGA